MAHLVRPASPGLLRVLRVLGLTVVVVVLGGGGWGRGRAIAAGFGEPEPVTIRSQSGQFVVRGLPQNPPMAGGSTSVVQYLRLDPNLTAISLERIRQALQTELDWPNQWQGMILVSTVPVRGENPRVTTTSVRHPNKWGYRIVYPEIVDKDRFLTAAVKTILMEFANRRALAREAELPAWVAEGLTAELLATSLPLLALEQASEVNRRGHSGDPLAEARERLRRREPVSFDELSMPVGTMNDEDAANYRDCAQVFVHELLRLHDGRACLRRFLEHLPENLNWQTTFLAAFDRHFQRLLDVDQWYSLSLSGVRGRDLSSIMAPAAALQQLDGILSTPVEVRVAAQELPIRTEMKLQRLVAEWEYSRQHGVLLEKISRLRALQGRTASDAGSLITAYLEALVAYVGPKNLTVPKRQKDLDRLHPRGAASSLIAQLDRLDLRRAALAPAPR